jgi:NADH-quinone oxidoreductase subunit A
MNGWNDAWNDAWNSAWNSIPVAFGILLLLGFGISAVASRLAFKPTMDPPGKRKPYACGEDVADHSMQPDYSFFFPFAFLFTIMHVVALLVATLPKGSGSAVLLALLLLLAAVAGISVLLKDEGAPADGQKD